MKARWFRLPPPLNAVRKIKPQVIRRLIGRFLPYVRPYRAALAGAFAVMLLASLMEVLQPLPLKILLDDILLASGPETPPILGAWPREHPFAASVLLAASILVVGALAGCFRYGYSVLAAQIGKKVAQAIRLDLYRHMLRLDMPFHRRTPTGELLTRLSGDVAQMKQALVESALLSLEGFLTLVGSVVAMLLLDWRLAIVASLMIPVKFGMAVVLSAPMRRAVRKARQGRSRLTGSAAMALAGIEAIKAYRAEAQEVERLASSSREDLKAEVRAARLEGRLRRNVEILIAAMTCAVLGVGGLLVLDGSLKVGSLVAFLQYLSRLSKPVRRLSRQSLRLSRASVCGERILDILEEAPSIVEGPDAVRAPAFRGRLTLDEVRFAYEDGREVLRGVSVEVPPGSLVALVGLSGAGKSTLARLLPRFFDPAAGRILIDGQDIRRFTIESLRERVAFSGQDPILFPVSVRENITLGWIAEVSDEEVERAARVAGADEFIGRLPAGYETILGERGVTLSGGERRRLDLTRIALSRARVVVLDEPTTGLDAASESLVLDGLTRTVRGRTTVLITHRLPLLERADLILVLDGGRLVEAGTHLELHAAGGLYRQLYDIYEKKRLVEVPGPLVEGR